MCRNVFIDTEAFKKGGFNFGATSFKELTRLAQKGKIRIFITSIVLREIRSHIHISVEEAASAIKRFRKTASILYTLPNLPFHGHLRKV